MEGERRQLEGNAQNNDNQQPSTSALCQELSNVITIDDDDELRQKTNSRILNGSDNDVCLLNFTI